MKNALLILLLTLSSSSFAQDRDSIKFSILKKEVQWFIDTAKTFTVDGGKYNVYTIYMYETFSEVNSICFKISFIENSYEYIYPVSPYMFVLKGEYVLISNPKGVAEKWVSNEYINVLNFVDKKMVKSKLAHDGTSIMRHKEQELICWHDGIQTRKKFCEDVCALTDFHSIKKSFYDDSVFEENSKIKYRYLDK